MQPDRVPSERFVALMVFNSLAAHQCRIGAIKYLFTCALIRHTDLLILFYTAVNEARYPR